VKRNRIINLVLIAGLLLTLVFAGGCIPQEGAEEGFDWTIIIFLVLIFGIFYFLMIRPQRQKQKEHQQLIAELKRGDKVVTAGGIYGRIESISDENVVIQVESGTMLRVAKSSVTLRQE